MAMTKEQLEKLKAGAEAAKKAGPPAAKPAKPETKDSWVSRLKSAVQRRLQSGKKPAPIAPSGRTTGIERGVGSALTKEELGRSRSPGVKK